MKSDYKELWYLLKRKQQDDERECHSSQGNKWPQNRGYEALDGKVQNLWIEKSLGYVKNTRWSESRNQQRALNSK